MKRLLALLLLLIPCLVWGQGFYSGPYYNNMKQLGVGRNLNNPITANTWLQVGDAGTTPNRANLYLYPTDTLLVTSPQKGFIVTQSSNGHTYGYEGTKWLDFGAAGDEQDPIAIAKTITLTQGTGITITGATQEIGDNPSFTITNSSPDQVVSLTGIGGISITGTYPNFTIAGSGSGDGNNYPTSLSFNTSSGVLTLGVFGMTSLTTNLDGRYIENEDDPVWSSVSNNYWTKAELSDGTAIVDWSSIVNAPTFLTSETDPTVPSHVKAITTTNISNWNAAYNDKVNSIAFSGTTTKTLTLTQQDAGTLTATFADLDTYVSGATWASASGVLTLARTGASNLTVNLDGRYLTSTTLTGDVTGSGGSSINTTISNNAVTFAKMQDISSGYIIGRYSSGTGDPQIISIGTGLNLNTSVGVLSATPYSESDPTVGSHIKAITVGQINNWDAAFNNQITGVSVTGTGTKTLTLTRQAGASLTTNFTDQGITSESDPTVPFYVKAITNIQIGNWDQAYSESISGASFSGTTTKTLTLNQRGGGTITASFTDLSGPGTETDPTVSSYTKGLTSDVAVINAVKNQDGSGSGLDADLLDGQQGSYYLDFNNATHKPGYILDVSRPDANANTSAYGSFEVGAFFSNTSGSTNYPSTTGGGILYHRADLTTASSLGSFQIWSANSASGSLLYKRVIATNTWGPWNTLWDSNNHPAGSAVSTTFSGASVPSTIVSNSAGHITSVTSRNLTPGDIGAAPSSGSGNYIQNQNSVAQSANGWINGLFNLGATTVGRVGLSPGNANNAGYIQFWRADGTRNGYIGWTNNSISYQAENGSTHEFGGGTVNMNTLMNFDAGIRSTNYMGMMGDYDINSTSPKIIWTIGNGWNTIATHYGLGYDYTDPPGPRTIDHQIVVRANGAAHHRFYMNGGYYMDGNIQSNGQGRFKGWYSGANDANGIGDGPAAEVGYSGGRATFLGYDRTAPGYIPLQLVGSQVFIQGTAESNTRMFASNATNYTYGTYYITGSRGGWSGLIFPDGGRVPTLMWTSSGPGGGIYQQGTGQWSLYYDGTDWHVNGTTNNTVWHSGNHPQGSAVNVTTASNEVIASVVSNSAGHITSVTKKSISIPGPYSQQEVFINNVNFLTSGNYTVIPATAGKRVLILRAFFNTKSRTTTGTGNYTCTISMGTNSADYTNISNNSTYTTGNPPANNYIMQGLFLSSNGGTFDISSTPVVFQITAGSPGVFSQLTGQIYIQYAIMDP